MGGRADRPERRKMPRIAERCRVAYRALRGGRAEAKVYAAETVNLSVSGLCLLAPEPLPRDTELALEICLEGTQEPVVAVGRVVWCAPEKKAHKVGVAFAWLRDEDRAALEVLERYVRERLGG
jgi:Tfp pilus assembly protein PilZ